jgi:hypothetical protein
MQAASGANKDTNTVLRYGGLRLAATAHTTESSLIGDQASAIHPPQMAHKSINQF